MVSQNNKKNYTLKSKFKEKDKIYKVFLLFLQKYLKNSKKL